MAVCGAHAEAPGLKAQQASSAPWAAEQNPRFHQPATNQEDAQVLYWLVMLWLIGGM